MGMEAVGAWVARITILLLSLRAAYQIRTYAIRDYGLVIHEFDPWFNFRATQYLHDHGYKAFFQWYDYESWYPLGRPVGTTIYPGMQITAVVLHQVLNQYLGIKISLNDVCCYIPCWFGVVATLALCLLTYECSRNANAAVASAALMAIVPAHIMRSVGGGFDNESVAMTAICGTFWLWCLSLRSDRTCIPIGILAGLSYVYMVAAWGGYIFVINMIGAHAGALVLMGRHSSRLHKAYTLFYIIGTLGAIQVPVVGWAPLKSLEQLGALGVFGLLQVVELCDWYKAKTNPDMSTAELMQLRVKALAGCGLAVVVLGGLFIPTGYFGPLSARIRGLLVKHTRTGNPLVDSVAEHQPASPRAYWQYLHYVYYLAPLGFVAQFFDMSDSKVFLILYASIAYYFSMKMVRLVLLLGPIGSALGGVALAFGAEWVYAQLICTLVEFGILEAPVEEETPLEEEVAAIKAVETPKTETPSKKGKAKSAKQAAVAAKKSRAAAAKQMTNPFTDIKESFGQMYETPGVQTARKVGALFLVYLFYTSAGHFSDYCHVMAENMSGPSIMYKASLNDAARTTIIVDDYREAYWWLRDNTPQDSRVMAWWDYGYQIAGIGNRTTIADGNTWNHEHIATLGKCLTSTEPKAHKLLRHLADYVLVWTGGGGDDLAKSPHMARICNSVYDTHCPGDPTCSKFQVTKSLLYTLTFHNQKPGVQANKAWFKEVFTSKYNKVRIYKVLKTSLKSRKWAADPANRVCDAPGSWYCEGQYSPEFMKLLHGKRSFKQVGDFNTKGTAKDDAYQKEYMRRMNGGGGEAPPAGEDAPTDGAAEAEAPKAKKKRKKRKKKGAE